MNRTKPECSEGLDCGGCRALPLVLFVGLVILNGMLGGAIRRSRLDSGLATPAVTGTPRMTEAAGKALGGLKTLAVDFLWLRSFRMQDEGRFHEIAALCETILHLQPYFPQVWAHQSWNMAYNIAIEEVTAADRWRWIKKAIELMAEDGIAKNPDTYQLYYETGWLYFHRVSFKSKDAFSEYYRRQIDPDNPYRCFELAREYFLQAEERRDCPKPLVSKLRIHCLTESGKFAEAEDEWAQLMREYPDDGTVADAFRNFLLLCVQFNHDNGNEEKSRQWFEKLEDYFPDNGISYEEALRIGEDI